MIVAPWLADHVAESKEVTRGKRRTELLFRVRWSRATGAGSPEVQGRGLLPGGGRAHSIGPGQPNAAQWAAMRRKRRHCVPAVRRWAKGARDGAGRACRLGLVGPN